MSVNATATNASAEALDYANTETFGGRCPIAPWRFFFAALLMAIAVGATITLVVSHFGVIEAPGCGHGGGCAAAANSKWGKLPLAGFTIPVSFLGCSYFTALFIAWWSCRRGVPNLILWFMRLGVLVSAGFVILIFTKKDLFCMYCLAAHISNIACWLLVETARPKRSASWRPVGSLVTIFLIAMTGLMFANSGANAAFEKDQAEQRRESEDEIIAKDKEKARLLAEQQAQKAAAKKDDPNGKPWEGGFTGRYLLGPEKAKVRIVMITDYQCPDCHRIEGEVMKYVKANKQVSLSIKHFPMCKDCNPNFQQKNLHPNACWAARAAETAGMLGGNTDFWTLHDWLFEMKGEFDAKQLSAKVAEMGYDPQEFFKEMTDDSKALKLVQRDIEEAIWLGLHFTPMVFINGVEVKGVFPRNAVPSAAQRILDADPPRMTAELDDPPAAGTKLVEDWEQSYQRRLPADNTDWPMGSGAKVRIDMYADFQEPYSQKADAEIRKWMKGRTDATYVFRHFPVDEACNDVTTRTIFDKSCIAHRAAVAAGLLGGADAYWKMHAAVYKNQSKVSLEFVRAQAKRIGLDLGAFDAKYASDETKAVIMEDARGCKSSKEAKNTLLYRGGIPTIFVNGKAVPRWRLGEDVFVKDILDRAAGEK